MKSVTTKFHPWAIVGVRSLALGAVVYAGALIVLFFLGLASVRRHHIESAWFWLAGLCILSGVLWGRRRSEDCPAPSPRDVWTVSAIAIVAAWLAYLPAFGIGLLSDDFVLLRSSSEGMFWAPWNGLWQPLPLIVWRLIWSATEAPWALHAANVTLHGAVSALAGLLALRSGLTRWWSVFVALAVCLQPFSVDAGAWASGIQDVLMAACVLLVVAIAGWRHYAARPLLFAVAAAALLSLEIATGRSPAARSERRMLIRMPPSACRLSSTNDDDTGSP